MVQSYQGSLNPGVPLRFRGTGMSPDPEKVQNQQTVRQAQALVKDQGVFQLQDQQSPIPYDQAQKALKENGGLNGIRAAFAFAMLWALSAVGLSQAGLGDSKASLEKAKASIAVSPYSLQSLERNVSEARGFRNGMVGIGSFFVGMASLGWVTAARRLKALQEDVAKKQIQLVLAPSSNIRSEQDLVRLLKARNDADLQSLADRMQALNETHPEAGDILKETFGTPDKLPGREELRTLFQYYAYQYELGNRSLSYDYQPKCEVKGYTPTTELAFQLSLYALLQAGMATGDLFSQLETSKHPNAAYQQQIGHSFYSLFRTASLYAEDETQAIRELLNKAYDVEQKSQATASSIQTMLEIAKAQNLPAPDVSSLNVMKEQLDAEHRSILEKAVFQGVSAPPGNLESNLFLEKFRDLLNAKMDQAREDANPLKAAADELNSSIGEQEAGKKYKAGS